MADTDYEIHLEDGVVLKGLLDKQGRAKHENVQRKKVVKVVYLPRKADKDKDTAVHHKLLS